MWKCNKNVVGLFYPHKHKLKFAFMRKRHQKESDLLQDHDWPWIHIGCKISDTFFVCMNTKKNHGIFFNVFLYILELWKNIVISTLFGILFPSFEWFQFTLNFFGGMYSNPFSECPYQNFIRCYLGAELFPDVTIF